MPEALISLPDSNLAVDRRFTGSKTKKAGDLSGSTETNNEETQSFSEIKRSLEKKSRERVGKGTEENTDKVRPSEQNKGKRSKPEETTAVDSGVIVTVASSYIHPETEAVPSIENIVPGEMVGTEEVTGVNVPKTEVPVVSVVSVTENIPITTESGNDAEVFQNNFASPEESVYEEMDTISIAARSFSDSVSTAKNNPVKNQMKVPQETTAESTSENENENETDPPDKLFRKNTGEPESIRDTVKVRENVTEKVSGKSGEKEQSNTSEQAPTDKTKTLSHDFRPFKGDFPEDIMEKNILGNFKLREFFNSINGKTSIQTKGLNSIKASLESMGDNLANLKINAAFQDGDSSGKFMLNINTNKEMLKIKTEAENGIAGLEGFKNQLESRFAENLKKVTASSHLSENAMTDVTSTIRQAQTASTEMKEDSIIPTVSKERFTDYFVSKVKEFFSDSVDGKKVMKVIISPPDLGEVKVTMEMKKSVLNASFQCSPEAAKAINNQVQNLSKSLSNVGVQLGSSNIDTGQHNANPQNYNQSQGYNHSSKFDGEVFPQQAIPDEGIFTENSKVFNVLI